MLRPTARPAISVWFRPVLETEFMIERAVGARTRTNASTQCTATLARPKTIRCMAWGPVALASYLVRPDCGAVMSSTPSKVHKHP